MTRRGDWLQTYTGRAFWPFDPRADDVDPDDIAHALPHLCRYGGHARRFYSVAEHCVVMSRAVAPEHALWALLHDASEAYLIDLPRPIKRHMPDYRYAERAVQVAICARFGLDPHEPAEVKDADNRITVDERRALLGPPPLPWRESEQLAPLGVTITGWTPTIAKAAYLARLSSLLTERAA